MSSPTLAAALGCAVLLAPSAAAQIFVSNTTDIPQGAPDNLSNSEEIEFVDVDLDGDWDAAWADGGDWFDDQNRLWINQGGLQAGGLGQFLDETDTRFPQVNDSSRDIDFADIDGDFDPDAVIANHSQIVNQSSAIWINSGGAQGGTLGFFADETAARWVGLGESGSSVAPALVFPPGGFITWSGDVDFADLDNDGDLDLVHTSYGGAFGGQVPTRLFLNDGGGFFSEFNPSGFSLPGSAISNGNPALWADGVQVNGTTDLTGAQADITTNGVDAEVYDFDGDFDLDLLLGAINDAPRFFGNKLSETGTLGFRDITAAVLPLDSISSNGKYEQELADLDGDLDLDLLGVNWGLGGFGFNEGVYEQVGSSYVYLGVLANSASDDEESDFLDYDNDGDLDLYMANFSGADRLYENGDGAEVFGLVEVPGAISGLAGSTVIARDADSADVDGDGDQDVFVANGTNPKANVFYENTLGTPDTTAPSIAAVEALADAPPTTGVRAVRMQILDNAPLYAVASQPASFGVSVDGVQLPAVDARWSGGQVFRAEVPANLVGAIALEPRAADEAGNLTVGSPVAYTAPGPAPVTFGGTSPSSVGVPFLRALSAPFPGETLYLGSSNVTAGSIGFFVLATAALPSPLDLGGGLVVNILNEFLILPAVADGDGNSAVGIGVPASLPSGPVIYAQYLASDGFGPAPWACSNGLTIAIP